MTANKLVSHYYEMKTFEDFIYEKRKREDDDLLDAIRYLTDWREGSKFPRISEQIEFKKREDEFNRKKETYDGKYGERYGGYFHQMLQTNEGTPLIVLESC